MARVYVTGDTHGDFYRIAKFCEDQQTDPSDIMIILGDAGINYYGDKRDEKLKKRLDKMPISFFCIHGNHERRPGTIPSYGNNSLLCRKYGDPYYVEKAHPGIMFAMDGGVYDFNGLKCIAIGGAYSVDKHYRLLMGWNWFPDEQPDDGTKRHVESVISCMNHGVDIVLSHTCPERYIPTEVFLPFIDQSTVDNSTEVWLGKIERDLVYDRWLCGHYHTDKKIDKLRFMFNDIAMLEDA